MDDKTNDSRENYDKKAWDYDSTPDGKYTLPFNRYLCEHVPLKEHDRILDVGCGNGRLLKMIMNKVKVEAYGIDVSEEMIKAAREDNHEITYGVSEADKTPFEDSFFNVITVCCAFHHFVNPEAFLREAHRILRPQGKIYIADPTAPGIIRHIENFYFARLKTGDVKIYSRAEMKDLFDRANLGGFTYMTDGYKMIVEGCRT